MDEGIKLGRVQEVRMGDKQGISYQTEGAVTVRNPFVNTYRENRMSPLLFFFLLAVPVLSSHPFYPMLGVGLTLSAINAYGHYHKSFATFWGAVYAGFTTYLELIAAVYAVEMTVMVLVSQSVLARILGFLIVVRWLVRIVTVKSRSEKRKSLAPQGGGVHA